MSAARSHDSSNPVIVNHKTENRSPNDFNEALNGFKLNESKR